MGSPMRLVLIKERYHDLGVMEPNNSVRYMQEFIHYKRQGDFHVFLSKGMMLIKPKLFKYTIMEWVEWIDWIKISPSI